MYDAGMQIQQIAYKHHMSWRDVADIIEFAKTGKKPKRKRGAGDDPRYAGWDRFRDVACDVARIRDEEGLDWSIIANRIGDQLGIEVAELTVIRAYDHAHRVTNREACGAAVKARKVRVDSKKHKAAVDLIKLQKYTDREISRRTGCAYRTVGRWRKKMGLPAVGQNGSKKST